MKFHAQNDKSGLGGGSVETSLGVLNPLIIPNWMSTGQRCLELKTVCTYHSNSDRDQKTNEARTATTTSTRITKMTTTDNHR